jgi:hypothetical protein
MRRHRAKDEPVSEPADRGQRLPPLLGTASAAVLGLQRTAGNAAVARLLAVQRARGGPCKLDAEEMPLQRTGPKAPPVVLPVGTAWKPGLHIKPNYVITRPAPTRSNSDPSTTSTDDPTFTGAPAVDAKDKVWRYQLATVDSKGTIQLVFFDVAHYPAPTPENDSGILSNVTAANWKDIVKDLRKNRSGVPDFWSAYRREHLHEDYHWNVEWQGQVNKQLPKAEKRIASLKVDFAAAPTEADAAVLLLPHATIVFKEEMDKARAAYDALGDSPGGPPYRAQAPALDALRARVNAHAKAQKWK